MNQPSRTSLLLACTTAVATCLVASAFLSIRGRAQTPPPSAPPSPTGTLAPLLGGNHPAPTQDVTITWDPRFQQVPRKASLAGQYLVIEGDILIGTQDAVRKAQRNELAGRARRLKGSVNFEQLGLPKPAVDQLNALSELPQETTEITPGTDATSSVAKTDAARLLDDDAKLNPGRPPETLRAFGLPLLSGYLWPGGEIPYTFDSSYQPYQSVFEDAIRRWQGKTTHLYLRPAVASDTHYLYVTLQTGDAGQSWVGMQPTKGQYVALLDPSRFPASHVAHEIGHAIGLFHEQTRPDRDDYIEVRYNNIQQNWWSQFAPPIQEATTLGTPFDFASIMLYNYQAGSVNPYSSFVPAVVSRYPSISGGQSHWGLGSSNIQGPSPTDIQAVEIMYPNDNPNAVAAAQAAPAAGAPAAAPALLPPPPGPPLPQSAPSVPIPPPSDAPAAAPAAAAPLVGNPSLPSTGSSFTITITVPYSAGSPIISTSGPLTAPTTGPANVPLPVGPQGVRPPVGSGSAPAPAGAAPSAADTSKTQSETSKANPQ